MGDVFVLGSGFSKAVSTDMPLTNDLKQPLALALERDKRFAHWVDDSSFKADDVERWLSRLSERHPFDDAATTAHNQATFYFAANQIAILIGDAERRIEKPPPWLCPLVESWIAQHATIITFNYDTIVETAFDSVNPSRMPPSPTLHRTLRPYAPADEGGRFDGPAFDKGMALCKLHGSTRWFWTSGNTGLAGASQEIVSAPVQKLWNFNQEDFPSAREHSPNGDDPRIEYRQPFIVPPAATKGPLLAHPVLERHWSTAAGAIRDASRIWIIGYSLPATDMMAGALIQNAPPKAEITLVTRGRSTDLRERFQRLFPNELALSTRTGEDAVARFAEDYAINHGKA